MFLNKVNSIFIKRFMDKDFVWTDDLVKQFAEEFRYSSSPNKC